MSASLWSNDKLFKPRIPKVDETDENEIKKKLSALKVDMSTLESSEILENTFSFDDVVEILEKENASLSKLLDYEETIRTSKLNKEKSILSTEKDEERDVISKCSDYVVNESFVKGEAVDNAQEMLLKLEVLHRKLITLLKKFAHSNFPAQKEKESVKSTRNRRNLGASKQKKSLLDILRLLLPELNSRDVDNVEQRILKIDESVPKKTIEFLLSSDIIEKCPDNLNCIKLLD